MLPKLIAIVGPTASGKTALAKQLAETFSGELISADSRQVYRGLDIGTGKEGQLIDNIRYLDTIPQWLIDICDPKDQYTVADFQKQALKLVDEITSRGKLPIIVGGTGLYITALLEGYDFTNRLSRDRANARHADKQYWHKSPPNWDTLLLGVELPRRELYDRIDQRVDDRLKAGMVDEARQLIATGLDLERLRQIGLEYRYLADYLEGRLNHQQFTERLKTAIHQFARRQQTWWRHHGNVQWVSNAQEAEKLVRASLT